MGKIKNQNLDPNSWVDDYGDYLFRFALSRVKNSEFAEEVVQETFVAAIQSLDSFSGKSSLKTWLVGILKHKIVDMIRKAYRERPYESVENIKSVTSDMFDPSGKWNMGPVEWNADPQEIAEHHEFWKVFNGCLKNLPENHYRVFMMREMDGIESEEICRVLDISSTNLWVMLHRARTALRSCLEHRWFSTGGQE